MRGKTSWRRKRFLTDRAVLTFLYVFVFFGFIGERIATGV
jgi:hypothetical protein